MFVPFAIGEHVVQFLAAMARLRDPHMDYRPVDDPIFFLGNDEATQHSAGIVWRKPKPAI
jgi:hypothetical protein